MTLGQAIAFASTESETLLKEEATAPSRSPLQAAKEQFDVLTAREREVAVLVAHGGNWILKPTIREIDLDRKGMHVIFTTPEAFTVAQGEFAELHAGHGETSLMMCLRPDLVKMDQVKPDFAPTQGREFFDYTGLRAVSPTGLWGAPSKASAEQGEQILRNATKRAVEYIRKTFAEIERLERERKQ